MNLSNNSAPIPVRIIRGTIVSNDEAASVNWDREALCAAFIDNGLQEFILHDSEWGVGGISFNSSSPVRGKSNRHGGIGKHAAAKVGRKFIDALSRVMQTEVAKELQISGYFDMSIDSGIEMVVFKVDIEDGEVSYQQAELVWSEKIILPS